MKYILIGRHTSEALGVQVAEQRNIMWATDLAECISQWKALQADAANAGMGVLLQNVPGILAVAIARAGFNAHTGVIISVQDETKRLAGVRKDFDMGCGRWAETAAAAVKHANGRAQTAVDGWTLSVTVDPVSPFVFKGIEWFNDAPKTPATPNPKPTKGAIVDASEAQALADLSVRSVNADDAPVAYYDLPPYMDKYPVPQPRWHDLRDPSGWAVRESYGTGEILRVSDTFAFARYEGLSADVYLRRPKGLALVVGQRIITEAPQRGAKGWSAEWVQDYKGRPNLSLTPEWVSQLPTLAEREAAVAEYKAAEAAYKAWKEARDEWGSVEGKRLAEIHGAGFRVTGFGRCEWFWSNLEAERWLRQQKWQAEKTAAEDAEKAFKARWDTLKAQDTANLRWQAPAHAARYFVETLDGEDYSADKLYCTPEGVALIDDISEYGRLPKLVELSWDKLARVMFRESNGIPHDDEDWDVPASAWVTLWTPPVDDADVVVGDDDNAPSLGDYASKLRGAA